MFQFFINRGGLYIGYCTVITSNLSFIGKCAITDINIFLIYLKLSILENSLAGDTAKKCEVQGYYEIQKNCKFL